MSVPHPTLNRRSFLMASAAFAVTIFDRPERAQAQSIQGLKGLNAPFEVLEDKWGIPHVKAGSIADAYFANGYLVAKDRLWQMDFSHRQSLGRLAEVFGEAFVASDVANRLFLFRGDADAELAAYHSTVQDAAHAYVAGINAYIRSVKDNPEHLPAEFSIFKYEPLEWSVRDLVRIRAEVTGNTELEIRRARLAARGALSYDSFVTPLQPAYTPQPLPGLDVHSFSEQDLGHLGVLQQRLPLGEIRAATLQGDPSHRKNNEGSNSWVVASDRTATGRPILANDPHLAFGAPGPRHVIHLTAPGLDVIGAGSPGMPGVMQGHNDHIAFGRTNFHIDQEDLFILKTHTNDPSRYWHLGKWRKMHEEIVRIAVRNSEDQSVTLRFAAQGPVISEDPERSRAVAVSATWLYPGANGLLANIGINLAHDWTSFREALRAHTSPTNFTYADGQGNIGWHAAGGLPQRAEHHDGMMPAPGDGLYDWEGLQPMDNLPSSFNPANGWFGTSNQMNLPPGYSQKNRKVSYEWSEPFRYERVAQVLDATSHGTVQESADLQHDTVSQLALQVIKLLPEQSEGTKFAYQLLKNWNGKIDHDSPAAALYEVWWTHLCVAIHAAIIPSELHDLLPAPLSPSVQLALLRSPEKHFGNNAQSVRDEILSRCLQKAVSELTSRLGALPASWKWGALHTVTLGHVLGNLTSIQNAFPNIGGENYGSGGDPYTVMARWYNPYHTSQNPYATTGGASFLMVCDVGSWDNSLFLNFPGQSADPMTGNYSDFFEPWLKGDMQPLYFSWSNIKKHTVRHYFFRP
ncbi:penicillin acylase family protein [Gluconobacter japonicus]|uniref:penicillin acylase family protein n=1 Tax=Gluconobacter japonicus TaxID=376620 RepID=UPI0039EBCA14